MLHYNQDKTMKSNKLLIALAGCAAFVATACHGDLDIIQDNQLTASNMWTESSDVTTSAYGIYYLMRANFVQDKVNVFYWGEARVGEYMWGAGSWRTGHDNDMYGVQNSTMNDSNASTVWTKLYTAVNAANAVLKYAPTVPMTDADRQWAIGQAAFARAYLYFWAVRLWGDVPLNLWPIESVDQPETYPVRAPKADVYARIGSDIESALALSDALGSDKYLATKTAVLMLKAEYCLWMYSAQKGGDAYLDGAEDALEMVRETGCDGVAIDRGCQGRPWLFADIRNAFAGSDERVNPTLGAVCDVIMRHARLLVEFYDGDERMAVHDLRKHIAWYLKGFPVGGSTRKAFMECESLADVDREIGKLDPTIEYPPRVVDKPRGRVRFAKKVHLPYGWLESRTTTHEEREALFGDDPMDASY